MRWWRWLALGGAAAFGIAPAYEAGGHHDTLFSLLDSRTTSPAASLTPRERDIVAFCAWLPDLSADLSATTLRLRLIRDKDDWRWGPFSQCGGRSSKLMVASQFYLHALTGSDVMPVRTAALEMAQELLQRKAGESPAGTELRLCTLGFTMHLLGDTFAHSRLRLRPWDSRATAHQLYDTGIGHFEVGLEPDYMLRRDAVRRRWLSPNDQPEDYIGNRWQDWVGTLSQLWPRRDNSGSDSLQKIGQRVVKRFVDTGRGHELAGRRGEDRMIAEINDGRKEAGSSTLPASAPARQISEPKPLKSKDWLSCRAQMPVLAALSSTTCDQVWQQFIQLAHRHFVGSSPKPIQPQARSCRLEMSGGSPLAPALDR